MVRTALVAISFLMSGGVAFADVGSVDSPTTPATLWTAWNADALITLNLGLLAWLYLRGVRRLWSKAGRDTGIHRGQAAAFLGSLTFLFVALLSPLHALSEELASAHMVQHMLLMTVAAPLFVAGSPGFAIAWGLPPDLRPWAGRLRRWLAADALGGPVLPGVLYAAALWAWHWPPAYEAALVDPLLHDVQHFSFFASACLFWRVMLDPLRRRRIHPLAAVIPLFATSLHATLLGVFMALSPEVWYGGYTERTAAWGFTPLEDQQLAGLIMWMPACLVYPAVAAGLLGAWLSALGKIPAQPLQRPIPGA